MKKINFQSLRNVLTGHPPVRWFGWVFTLLGVFIFILGAQPGWFGLDISAAVGFVQLGVFSFGLLLICLGGTLGLGSLWPSYWRSIAADFGLRLAWTGLIIAITSALADVFGLGTRPLLYSFTFFGYWQARGVMIGEVVMLIGFVLMIPFRTDFPPPPLDSEEEQNAQANPPARF